MFIRLMLSLAAVAVAAADMKPKFRPPSAAEVFD
jgi:hypothetical protein